MSHCACHMSSMSNAYVDPWDMLNYFCFLCLCSKVTVNRRKWQCFFTPSAPYPDSLDFIELVPS